ncbi:MAG: hypothetical protein ACJ8C4_14400 [Gemmataceae bacterium]
MVLALFRRRVVSNRPQAVVALTDAALAAELASQLVRAGWHVHLAPSASAARRLTARHTASVVVLSANRTEETGYLTCAKLQRCKHKPRVILVADEAKNGRKEFAAYVGASDLLAAEAGPRTIAHRVKSLLPVAV